ncbi:YihY family inner membrane protein [uncultured Umboniibacter sp.]|uniref:YihY family inner membrane protein n=1 Tax=uncultured Umboniibacter sp. TaxID=1798917 RepID=UPI002638FDE0|nr:YihY family inner membrane protein [uncultured Umboniibacter sp.]
MEEVADTIITTTRERMLEFIRFCRFVLRRFVDDGCAHAAAALTYTSLFAIVPALTVMVTIIAIVPAFEPALQQAQGFLLSHLVPASSETVQSALVGFTNEAKKLTGFSVLLLIVTVVLLLNTIEGAFNRIWGIKQRRKLRPKLMLYWTLISLGPILLGAAAAASAALAQSEYISWFDFERLNWLLAPLPWVFNCLLFSMLLAYVPNCYVSARDAVIGGMVTASLFLLVQHFLSLGALNPNYSAIYGTFAAVPIFLLWIYVSWIIVLFGANLTRCLPRYFTTNRASSSRLMVATAVLRWLWANHEKGQRLSERKWIGGKIKSLPLESHADWLALRHRLVAERILLVNDEDELAIGRDLTRYSIGDFLRILEPNVLMADTLRRTKDRLPASVRASLKGLQTNTDELLQQPLSVWLEKG